MKKILLILCASSLLVFSSCGGTTHTTGDITNTGASESPSLVDVMTMSSEFTVEWISTVDLIEGDNTLILSRKDPDSDATQYVYVPQEKWQTFDASGTTFAVDSHVYFSGAVALVTADSAGHYYAATQIDRLEKTTQEQ